MKKTFLICILFCMLAVMNAALLVDGQMETANRSIINVPGDYTTIQEAISASVNGDTILVDEGTYFENINFIGRAITIASYYLIDEDYSHIENTIIDGSQPSNPNYSSVVRYTSGEGLESILCGFTLTGGAGSYEPGVGMFGGGISMHNSSPRLENLIITDNVILNSSGGSGIYCSMSSPSIYNVVITNNSSGWGAGVFCFGNVVPSLENVIITGNSAYENGGGIFNNMTNMTLKNATISGNSAGDSGGGICCWNNSDPTFENVIISDNSAWDTGGGIYCWDNSNPVLRNVIITGNSADEEGGGIACLTNSGIEMINVTMSDNTADIGGGIWCRNNSNPELLNCTFWNDLPEEICFHYGDNPNTVTISYSDIQGGEEAIVIYNGAVNWLEGNIDEDPLFAGTGEYPFSLLDDSPCINAGIQDITGLELPELDPAGNPRVFGGRIDMGTFENQNVIVNTDEELVDPAAKLSQNYPNPFNPTTTIAFEIHGEDAQLGIYNIKGMKVKHFSLTSRQTSITWDGTNDNGQTVSSGVYFYMLRSGGFEQKNKMLLLK
ncbi:MAG: choice-of-anchor Q domain-containing protein [Candidatus Stygibacter australis]|nr:choice-of-anchor Q domain-containing protein [Candidatus Stygibacter australis]MDP8322163.1 choice-of-anchor Q domain-containing protein [Candidatus Stygibacter australis]